MFKKNLLNMLKKIIYIITIKKHLEQYPHITFNSTEEVNMFRLDDIDLDLTQYNFLYNIQSLLNLF